MHYREFLIIIYTYVAIPVYVPIPCVLYIQLAIATRSVADHAFVTPIAIIWMSITIAT